MTDKKKAVTGKCDGPLSNTQDALSKTQSHVNSVPTRIQAPGSFPTTIFLDLQRSQQHRLRVDVHEYRGRKFVGIRNYYQDGSGEWLASNHGVSIRPEHVAAVVQALMLAGQAFDPKEGA
jgi:hypothetical protein